MNLCLFLCQNIMCLATLNTLDYSFFKSIQTLNVLEMAKREKMKDFKVMLLRFCINKQLSSLNYLRSFVLVMIWSLMKHISKRALSSLTLFFRLIELDYDCEKFFKFERI